MVLRMMARLSGVSSFKIIDGHPVEARTPS
jgi:hypothetical protein